MNDLTPVGDNVARLMAQALLSLADGEVVLLTAGERKRCQRIAILPRREDVEYLARFEPFATSAPRRLRMASRSLKEGR
jgi:hypothetical protein